MHDINIIYINALNYGTYYIHAHRTPSILACAYPAQCVEWCQLTNLPPLAARSLGQGSMLRITPRLGRMSPDTFSCRLNLTSTGIYISRVVCMRFLTGREYTTSRRSNAARDLMLKDAVFGRDGASEVE